MSGNSLLKDTTSRAPHSKPGDARLGDLLEKGLNGDIVFVLYPCDIGVKRNGGRVGARVGPAKFLYFLKRIGSTENEEYRVNLSWLRLSYAMVSLDDLEEDDLEEAHVRLAETVSKVFANGGLPFVVGGGNDQSYCNWLALRESIDDSTALTGVVNVDAHLDVRPVINGRGNSGTPFRQILEHDSVSTTSFTEFAAQASQCSKTHADYVKSKGGTILWLKDVIGDAPAKFECVLSDWESRNIQHGFVSFDLDSIKASDCPGVSCPANTGLSAEDALGIMRAAGESPTVKLVDVSEMNPLIEEYITPRLAVNMAYNFLIGYCKRRKRMIRSGTLPRPYRLRISHLSQLVCVEDVQKQGFRTGRHMSELSIIDDGTIIVDQNGIVSYAGSTTDAPSVDECDIDTDMDGRNKSAIPGLCDAHTHSVWAGDRVHEFAMKLAGASYMDIHKIGGISYTVKHTRAADEETLYKDLISRLKCMNVMGTTLVECKSGYGLDTDTEMKMLRVIDRAQRNMSTIDIVGNFCGAHSIPDDSTEEEAMDTVVNEMIPALAKEQAEGRLSCVKLIDVFAEDGVFNPESTRLVLEAGEAIGLLGNFHGDELTYQGCGELAGKLKCRAVSHLEHVSDEGIAAMGESQTAAVLLPTTAYALRIKPAPARKLIDNDVPVALGSDFNPNAHCLSMPHVMNLACITMKMTVEEALVASTLNAAYSMNMQETHGTLEIGKHGDMVLVDAPRWEHVIYQFGGPPPISVVIKDGRVLHGGGISDLCDQHKCNCQSNTNGRESPCCSSVTEESLDDEHALLYCSL